MFATRNAALLLLVVVAICSQAHAWWLFSGAPTEQVAQVKPTAPITSTSTSGTPLKAMARFDMDDVRGFIQFSSQMAATTLNSAPSQPIIRVDYDLTGLKGNNKFYHVHVRPVPPFDRDQVRGNSTALAKLCGDPATGGHLNPHHITQKLPPKSAPLDKYETGDLSGKHGPLMAAPGADPKADRYLGTYLDEKLPMSGPNSIVGRSIVIHKNDGSRWVCATIEAESY